MTEPINELSEDQIEELLNKPIKKNPYINDVELFNNVKILENNVLCFESQTQSSKSLQKDIKIALEYIENIDEFIEILKAKKTELKAKIEKNRSFLGIGKK